METPKKARPTARKINSSVKKTPDFRALHQAAFGRMRPLADYARKGPAAAAAAGSKPAQKTTKEIPRLRLEDAKKQPLRAPIKARAGEGEKGPVAQAKKEIADFRDEQRYELRKPRRRL